jgi:hypothetical protein
VDGAADVELLTAKLTKATAKRKTPPERRVGGKMFTIEI